MFVISEIVKFYSTPKAAEDENVHNLTAAEEKTEIYLVRATDSRTQVKKSSEEKKENDAREKCKAGADTSIQIISIPIVNV